jgi:hypothetical protein
VYAVVIKWDSSTEIRSRHRSLVMAWAKANQLANRLWTQGSHDAARRVSVESLPPRRAAA